MLKFLPPDCRTAIVDHTTSPSSTFGLVDYQMVCSHGELVMEVGVLAWQFGYGQFYVSRSSRMSSLQFYQIGDWSFQTSRFSYSLTSS